MKNRTTKAMRASKRYAEKAFGVSINPGIKEVNTLKDLNLLKSYNVKNKNIIFVDNFKIPFLENFFFFNFIRKEEIGYEIKEQFIFNEHVIAEKGDYISISLNNNLYNSDLSFLVNGKAFGISSSLINYDKKIKDLDMNNNEKSLIIFLKDLEEKIV